MSANTRTSSKRWNAVEDARLLASIKAGKSVAEIASDHSRSATAIGLRLRKIALNLWASAQLPLREISIITGLSVEQIKRTIQKNSSPTTDGENEDEDPSAVLPGAAAAANSGAGAGAGADSVSSSEPESPSPPLSSTPPPSSPPSLPEALSTPIHVIESDRIRRIIDVEPSPVVAAVAASSHAASAAVSFDSDDIVSTFAPEQRRAFEAYTARKNVFITGPGGYGKSYLIKAIVHHARRQKRQLAVCAMTGCAAVLLDCGATTLHRWARVGLAKADRENILTFLVKSKMCRENWETTDLLIVDEVSMMSKHLFDLFNFVAQKVRHNRRPFGGIQLLFCGDFFQLPPVGDPDVPDSDLFCFESDDWNTTFDAQIELRTPFRHKDEVFARILQELRSGKIRRSSYDLIMTRVGAEFDLTRHSGVRPVSIVPTRHEAQMINDDNMRRLDGELREFPAKFGVLEQDNPFDVVSSRRGREYVKILSHEEQRKEEERLYETLNVERHLKLKVGSQVMCIKNMPKEGLVNGSTGVVVGFEGNGVLVKFYGVTTSMGKYGTGIIRVVPIEWQSDRFPKYGITQFPLILAWAITIHKSQGMTLDLAEINAGSSIFACGQTYVAMSRVKTLAGLCLTSFDPGRVKINRRVLDFYTRLAEMNGVAAISS